MGAKVRKGDHIDTKSQNNINPIHIGETSKIKLINIEKSMHVLKAQNKFNIALGRNNTDEKVESEPEAIVDAINKSSYIHEHGISIVIGSSSHGITTMNKDQIEYYSCNKRNQITKELVWTYIVILNTVFRTAHHILH